jgi:hypothetical protein
MFIYIHICVNISNWLTIQDVALFTIMPMTWRIFVPIFISLVWLQWLFSPFLKIFSYLLYFHLTMLSPLTSLFQRKKLMNMQRPEISIMYFISNKTFVSNMRIFEFQSFRFYLYNIWKIKYNFENNIIFALFFLILNIS